MVEYDKSHIFVEIFNALFMEDNRKEVLVEEEQNETIAVDETVVKPSYFVRLKEKWNLKNMGQLVLVLITFTIGGSICGYLTGKIMMASPMSAKSPLWWISYVVLASIIWPACVYVISFFFGQQKFFKKYLIKMGNRMFGKK